MSVKEFFEFKLSYHEVLNSRDKKNLTIPIYLSFEIRMNHYDSCAIMSFRHRL